jgi:hypothetical protein
VLFASLLTILLSSASPRADRHDAELAALAEAAFTEGLRLRNDAAAAAPHFRDAAKNYQELCRRGAGSTALYRNLGHSWLLAGDLPRAVLTYRQGLRSWPMDRGLHDDLAAARQEVVLAPGSSLGRPPTDPLWWPPAGAAPLTAAAAVLYTLACVSLTRWWMTRRRLLLLGGMSLLIAAGAAGGFAVQEVRAAQYAQTHPLVVIAEDGVLLRRGDGLNFPPRYGSTPVNRGAEARLLFERGDWLQVELASGEVGWIPRAYALVDSP